MLHRGVLHSAMPGMAPHAFPPHMPHGGMSPGGKGMPPGFEGMPPGGYPMGIMLNLQPPPPSMPPPNKPALWEKIQDSRRDPVTIGSMPVGCPHGKSRRPLPAIGSASSMSIECLLLLERDDGQISLRPPVSVGDVAAAGSAEVTLCNAKADPKL